MTFNRLMDGAKPKQGIEAEPIHFAEHRSSANYVSTRDACSVTNDSLFITYGDLHIIAGISLSLYVISNGDGYTTQN